MINVPEQWQLRQFADVIDASPLAASSFSWRHVDQGGSVNTAFRFSHDGYPDATFFVEWMNLRDPGGYGARGKGDWHVEMAPAIESPYDKFHYIAWDDVIGRFREWVSCLAREFEAAEDWGHFVHLPRISPPSPPTTERFNPGELKLIEPVITAAENDFDEVIEHQFATRADINELRTWLKEEFDDVRRELREQTKKGARRSLFGLGANLAMKFGPQVWQEMVPIFERLMHAVDSVPKLHP